LSACGTNAEAIDTTNIVDYYAQYHDTQADTTLKNAQDKILSVFVQSLMAKNTQSINELEQQITKLKTGKTKNLATYWHSYLSFYKSIYWLKTKNKDEANKEIEKGIETIKSLKGKNSEDYALLAMLQSFSIQFKSTLQIVSLSPKIKSNAEAAIKIDKQNPRAYFVLASNDFYTPEQYGGGKEAEKLLLKAIELPAQKTNNPYLPSWGKEEAYEMLIKLYMKQEKFDLAKKYFAEGIEAYPESYVINQLAAKLVNK